jgi:putative intracellular protease/amidase
MSADQQAAQDAGLDEDGLVIQTYLSTVLVVVPASGYGEQAMRFARSSLANVHVGTRSVSREFDAEIKGRLQDEFLVDEPLAGQSMERYSGILICGGESEELSADADVQRLLGEAAAAGKMIACYGNGLAALARAGVIKGKRVTGDPSCADAARKAGGKYTGRQLEVAGQVITALDESSGMRFGKALAQVVGI